MWFHAQIGLKSNLSGENWPLSKEGLSYNAVLQFDSLKAEILQNRPFKNKCQRPAKNSHWWIAIWIEVLRPQASSSMQIINQLNQPRAAEHTWAENGSRWKSLIGFSIPLSNHSTINPSHIPSLYHHLLPKWSRGNSHKEAILFLYIIFPWGWLLCYVAFHIDQYWTHLATPVVSSPQPARRWQPILLAVQMQQPERGEKVLPAMGIPIRNIRNKHEQTTYRNIWVCNGYTYITSLNQLTLYNIPSGSRRYKVYMGIQGFEDCPGIKEMDKPCLTKNVGFLTTRMDGNQQQLRKIVKNSPGCQLLIIMIRLLRPKPYLKRPTHLISLDARRTQVNG